ncbi:type IV pilus twitching motility protein PilT [Aquisphaera insulae]|uniref:type IV pilus twitching motility protein PilT n=1 Tax=Aquisphaera insulae TaxID=2712864 RepID=UPI0013EDCD4F|nr:PilT/PilU family type 4a pilus ATPase [Aquisphaera insulae]
MSTAAVEANVETMPNEPEANKLFRMVMKYKGSDLHLKVGVAPSMRLAGVLRQMQLPQLTSSDMERLMYPLLTPRQRGILDEEGGVDFAHIIYDGDIETRFRVNLFKQRGRLSLVARRVNNKIPSFEDLHLPQVLADITQYDQGIIILAGVTGSGKSTTIASMLQYMNERERLHIVTVEDPIEYTFKDDKSIINQREVGIDVIDWDVALKHAVRQDPDVILVGEMRDRETFSAAMHAAETGHLVFGTIHAGTAPSTIGRLLDLFPRDMHSSLRQSLAFNLKAIIAQKLLPTTKELTAKGTTRVPTNEIMRINPTVRKLILNEEDTKLGDAIRIGKEEGMMDFTESLRLLVVAEKVERATAFEVAPSPEALKMALKGITIAQPGIL